MQNLINVNEELKITIRSSQKKCCCLRFDDLIFGRLDQAKYILMETFDGKHIALDGPDGNKIDCMFFPCTSKEEVLLDHSVSLDGRVKLAESKHRSQVSTLHHITEEGTTSLVNHSND